MSVFPIHIGQCNVLFVPIQFNSIQSITIDSMLQRIGNSPGRNLRVLHGDAPVPKLVDLCYRILFRDNTAALLRQAS